jgi:peptidyl-prolyl cis-trans isomerase SurA
MIAALAVLASFATGAKAQGIVVLVNDEPITTYDVAQRQRWLSRTSGFGDRMKAALASDTTKQKFKEMMVAANPRSREEAERIAEDVKKQLINDVKNRVLGESGAASRKQAIDALIDDKLKIQAARKLNVSVSDQDVNEMLSQRAKTPDGKTDLNGFFAQFESDGISRKTVMEVMRAQMAWREVVRKTYGSRITASLSITQPEAQAEKSETLYDARVLRVPVSSSTDQAAVSRRILEAERLRERFSSCTELAKQVKLVPGASLKTVDKAKIGAFTRDLQPMVQKAAEGQMTPPVLAGDAVEAVAVCKKAVLKTASASSAGKDGDEAPDKRQMQFERYSKRHLQDLKQSASIDYRDKGSGS